MRKIIALLGFLALNSYALAQVDTAFWFAVPDVSAAHGDNPISLTIATYSKAATVKVSVPANPSITPITLAVGANSSMAISLDSWKDRLENSIPDSILSRGLLIQSNTMIAAYYEINSGNNSEIFTLKGRNGLGTDFYTPFQFRYSNVSSAPFTDNYSSIDIVATGSCQIRITPTCKYFNRSGSIVTTLTPFTKNLVRGETYSIRSAIKQKNGIQDSTLTGTRIQVISGPAVAVTIKDDGVQNGDFDVVGDQIQPVNLTGKEYAVVKGNPFASDYLYLLNVESTAATVNYGGSTMTINPGQTKEITVDANMYISSTRNCYALHFTGLNNEFSEAILPKLECTGSVQTSFTKPTSSDSAFLLISVPTSGIAGFKLGGTTVSSSNFTAIPNSNWSAARLNITTLTNGSPYIVTNSISPFHLGMLNRTFVGTTDIYRGAEYGFFSNYAFKVDAGADTIICPGGTATLYNPSAFYNYQYKVIQGDSSALPVGGTTNVKPSKTTIYVLSRLDSCATPDTVIVIVDIPKANAGIDTVLCFGQSKKIGGSPTASNGYKKYTYNWSPSTSLSSATDSNPTVTANSSFTITDYVVLITDSIGCTHRDTIRITLAGKVVANAGPDKQVCAGDSVMIGNFTPSGGDGSGFQFKWTPASEYFYPNNTDIKPYVRSKSPETYTDYILTATTSLAKCVGSDTVRVTTKPSPKVNAGNDTTICAGDKIRLKATPLNSGGTFAWFDPSNIGNKDTVTVSPLLITAPYYVQYTLNGCSALDTVIINVKANPVIHIEPDTTICNGGVTTITTSVSPSGGTYLWSTGATSNSITVSPSYVTQYSVKYTQNGCSSKDSSWVIIQIGPKISLKDTAICLGETVTLKPNGTQAPPNGSFLWFDGPYTSTGQTLTVTPTQTSMYILRYKENSCTVYDTSTITVHSLPKVTANDAQNCPNQSNRLEAIGGPGARTFDWTPKLNITPASGLGAVVTVSPAISRSYIVVLTDSNGCKAQDTSIITISQISDNEIGLSACSLTDPILLTGSEPHGGKGAPYKFTWQRTVTPTVAPTWTGMIPAETSQNMTANGTTGFWYKRIVEQDGCRPSISDSIQVNNINPQENWPVVYEGTNRTRGYSVATDPSGNLYVGGEFNDQIELGKPKTTQGVVGLGGQFIQKLSACGEELWRIRIDNTPESQKPMSLYHDNKGFVYICGLTYSNMTITDATGSVYTMTQPDYNSENYLIKISDAGKFVKGIWTGNYRFWTFAIDEKKQTGVAVFGSDNSPGTPGNIRRYDPQLNLLWKDNIDGGIGTIDFEDNGGIAGVVAYSGSCTFSNGNTYTKSASSDFDLAYFRYAPNTTTPTLLNTKNFQTQGGILPYDFKINGSSYVGCGTISKGLTLDSYSIPGTPNGSFSTACIFSLNSSGQVTWLNAGPSAEYCNYGLTFDDLGNPMTVGQKAGLADPILTITSYLNTPVSSTGSATVLKQWATGEGVSYIPAIVYSTASKQGYITSEFNSTTLNFPGQGTAANSNPGAAGFVTKFELVGNFVAKKEESILTEELEGIANATGIANKNENANIKLHPNPTSGDLIFDFNQNGITVSIHDMNGKELQSFSNIKSGQPITLNLSSGLYFVKIYSEERFIFTEKIIVNK